MDDTLKTMLEKFIDEYAVELAQARSTENFKRPFGDFVRKDIAGKIQRTVTNENYKVKGSVGAGRWTDVPWIAVFDTRITKSAQRGVYIVYLLNKDTRTLYLTLNQGATDVAQGGSSAKEGKLAFTRIATADNVKTIESLKERAQVIRDAIGDHGNALSGFINSGSKAYDAGCIFYKEYTASNVPNDEILKNDLNLFIDLYKKYYDLFVDKNVLIKNSKEKEGEEKLPVSTKELLT